MGVLNRFQSNQQVINYINGMSYKSMQTTETDNAITMMMNDVRTCEHYLNIFIMNLARHCVMFALIHSLCA